MHVCNKTQITQFLSRFNNFFPAFCCTCKKLSSDPLKLQISRRFAVKRYLFIEKKKIKDESCTTVLLMI